MQMSRQILVAAAVLATLSVVVSGQPGFKFYKLCISWQPSVCNARSASSPCTVAPQQKFTIHGLWPQLQGDVAVRPYGQDPTCTQTTPTTAANIVPEIQPIQNELLQEWPSILPGKTSLQFWQHEWERHGMCSDYLVFPRLYFQNSLNLYERFKNLPTDAGIALDVQYTADEIVNTIQQKFGAKPQIACNRNRVNRNIQVWEVRFCYERAWVLVDCPFPIANSCPPPTPTSPNKIVLPSYP